MLSQGIVSLQVVSGPYCADLIEQLGWEQVNDNIDLTPSNSTYS